MLDQTQNPDQQDVVTTSEQSSAPEQVARELIKPKKYLCFAEAHNFARSLNFKTRKEWRLYVKSGMPTLPPKPDNIPAHPDGIYRLKGWQGWKYWLGTANQGLTAPGTTSSSDQLH